MLMVSRCAGLSGGVAEGDEEVYGRMAAGDQAGIRPRDEVAACTSRSLVATAERRVAA